MLDPRQSEIVKSILSRYVPQYEVRAFGSRVNGSHKKHSDLDIAVMTKKPLPVKLMANMRHAFSESDLPFKVDVVDWSTISEGFREIILQGKCEILQQKQI